MTPALATAPNAVVAVAALRALTYITSKRRRPLLGALALVRRPRARTHLSRARGPSNTPLAVG
jgi:hypothetical protein